MGERYGEDECTFFLHLIKCIQDACHSELQWDTIIDAGNYHSLHERWQANEELTRKSNMHVWVRLEQAVEAMVSRYGKILHSHVCKYLTPLTPVLF